MKNIHIVALVLACLILSSCKDKAKLSTLTGINPETGIPYSTTEGLEAMEGTQSVYDGSMSRWRERVASSLTPSPRESYPNGPCIRPNAGFSAADLAREFLNKSQHYRESLGGRGCQCLPMGELCLPNICNCSEICPNDHSIFRGQGPQIMPTAHNQLAFSNRVGNTGAFATYPNTEGVCTGMQLQRRKFSSLARFRPNLYSRPAMTVPGPAYVSYIKREIDRMVIGLDPNFLGAANLTELRRKDPEIDRYFREQTGAGPIGEVIRDIAGPNPFAERIIPPVVDGDSYIPTKGAAPVIVHFGEPTTTNIPAYRAQDPDIDPETNAPYGTIPVPGTTEYVNYMKKKVERVCQGFPGIIPGYPGVYSLSHHPSYQEIIGRYSAIDWQHMNALDDRYAPGVAPFRSADWATVSYLPMATSDSDSLLEGLQNRLPSYSGTAAGPWNASGPWQSVSLEFKGSFNPALGTGSGNGKFSHSVEAYALSPQSNGDVHVCIADPNHAGILPNSTSADCRNYMTIPAKGSDGKRPGMSYNSPGFVPRIMGKVGIQPSSDRYQGLMTTRMIEYCRTLNRGKFNINDCGGAP